MNPSTLLALDPGLRCVGVALFRDGALVRAAALRGPARGRGPSVWAAYAPLVQDWLPMSVELLIGKGGTVLVEQMQVHAHGGADPADILELAGVSGAVVGALSVAGWSAAGALARDWKGQIPRDVFGARVEGHLRDEGLLHLVEPTSRATERNDIMHAVGLGRWWIKTHPDHLSRR